jgi:hypothetical protein
MISPNPKPALRDEDVSWHCQLALLGRALENERLLTKLVVEPRSWQMVVAGHGDALFQMPTLGLLPQLQLVPGRHLRPAPWHAIKRAGCPLRACRPPLLGACVATTQRRSPHARLEPVGGHIFRAAMPGSGQPRQLPCATFQY